MSQGVKSRFTMTVIIYWYWLQHSGDKLLGREVPEHPGWWVKGVLKSDKSTYMTAYFKGSSRVAVVSYPKLS